MDFDRTVEKALLDALKVGGFAHSLVEYAKSRRLAMDLAMRSTRKHGKEATEDHATLYVGLTAVLNLHSQRSSGRYKLTAHKSYMESPAFDNGWVKWQDRAAIASNWPQVEAYLESKVLGVDKRLFSKEGTLQAAVASATGGEFATVDREVVMRFPTDVERKTVMAAENRHVMRVLKGMDTGGFGKLPASFGPELDVLGLGSDGRLLAIEVKPAGTASIAWAPAQALMYALLIQIWLNEDPTEARRVIQRMLDQRRLVGLTGSKRFSLASKPEVVPYVAIQRSANPVHLERAKAVAWAIANAGLGPPPELRLIDLAGQLHKVSYP